MAEVTAGYSDESNAHLEHVRMELQKSITELGSKRSRDGTLEDTLKNYSDLLEKSHQIVAGSWDGQAARLRRDNPGNASFNLHPAHDDAEKILADHDGPQVLLNAIKAQTYNMTLDEYATERDAKRVEIASIRYELARRESDVKIQPAEAAFDAEIQRIPKYKENE